MIHDHQSARHNLYLENSTLSPLWTAQEKYSFKKPILNTENICINVFVGTYNADISNFDLCLSVVTLFAFLCLKFIVLQLVCGIQAFKDTTLFTCSDVSFFLLHVGLFSPLFMDFCKRKQNKKQWVLASYRCYIGPSHFLGVVWAWSHGHLGLVLVHFVVLKIWYFQNYSTYILKKTIQQA